jgi:hypothetical protein
MKFYTRLGNFRRKKSNRPSKPYEIINFPVGGDFESGAKLWLREKNFKSVNTCSSVVIIWTL